MKKLLLLTGLLASLFISCSKEEKTVVNDSIGNLENLEVHAVIGDNAVTKTAVQSNGTDIYWTQGDAINLFYGNRTSAQFTTSINSPTASASFQGSITAVTGTNGNGNGAQSFWGVYPYNASNSCDGNGVTLTIPSEQSGVAGTFASNLNPTVAKSPNLDLAFYNVGSWFVFSVTRNDIVSVTFQGNASETLVGKVRVEMDGNSRPAVTQVTNGVTSITMTPVGGGCFTSGKDYYMVLIPQTLSNGYSVTLNTSDGSFATCVVEGSKEFPRSGARGKHNVDDGLNFNIEFRDAKVKEICVANWDTNGDDELSYGEAAAVTSISYNVFHNNNAHLQIQYFDEFQYFTGLTSSSSLGYEEERDEGVYDYYGVFYNCNRLKSITLPSTLTTIGIACFRECTSLQEITIPASVTIIKAIAFLGCTQLNVHMESETPCTLTKDPRGTWQSDPYAFGFLANGRVKAIYVPESAVDTYKNATYWPSGLIRAQYEYVDLGLSVKWATHNVGATSPEEYGDYYAWGETEPYYEVGYAQESPQAHWKDGYSAGYGWSTYKWFNGSSYTYTKYNTSTSYGTVDNKTVLDPEDDVAHVKWGGSWRMPTKAEQDELRNSCTWTWYSSGNTEFNGVAGYKVTSNVSGYTDRFIFLPAAGYRDDTSLYEAGEYGYYWSSSLHSYNTDRAWSLYVDSGPYSLVGYDYRFDGQSVRPVCP